MHRPLLTRRMTIRLYRDLETDLLNEAHQFHVSLNERVLNILENHFAQVMTFAFSYPFELRPLWKNRQGARCQTINRTV